MRGQAEVVFLPPDNIDWTILSCFKGIREDTVLLILVDYTDYITFSTPELL